MMDCNGAKEFLDPFSDGELDPACQAEVRSHLNDCEGCAARVVEIDTAREALKSAYGSVRPPDALRERIRQVAESAPARRSVLGDGVGSTGTFHRRAWIVPMGIAAALLLSFGLLREWPTPSPHGPDDPLDAARLVADVRGQHLGCVRNGLSAHHAADLPMDLLQIAEILSREFELDVEAPNLDHEGFTFVGADRCGIRGRPGAHLLYSSNSPATILSLFTVSRFSEIEMQTGDDGLKSKYFVAADDSLNVVVWHDGRQSNVICSELPPKDIMDLADGIRVAASGSPADTQFALLCTSDANW